MTVLASACFSCDSSVPDWCRDRITIKHRLTGKSRLIFKLTKWRIDEARKHAFVNSPGRVIEPSTLQRCRLNPTKVDHFLDFIASPSFLQDVAYGTKNIKLSSGERIEIPNVVRTVIASRLIQLYHSYCSETSFTPLGRSTLFNILKVSCLGRVLGWTAEPWCRHLPRLTIFLIVSFKQAFVIGLLILFNWTYT